MFEEYHPRVVIVTVRDEEERVIVEKSRAVLEVC